MPAFRVVPACHLLLRPLLSRKVSAARSSTEQLPRGIDARAEKLSGYEERGALREPSELVIVKLPDYVRAEIEDQEEQAIINEPPDNSRPPVKIHQTIILQRLDNNEAEQEEKQPSSGKRVIYIRVRKFAYRTISRDVQSFGKDFFENEERGRQIRRAEKDPRQTD